MKAVILKDRFNVHAVFVVNDISDKDIEQLQDIATHYMQEVVIKETTAVSLGKSMVGDIITEIRALNDMEESDDEG